VATGLELRGQAAVADNRLGTAREEAHRPTLRHHDDRAARMPRQPAGYGSGHVMPEMPWCPDNERVRAEFPGDRGQFPGRVTAAGPDVHFELTGIGDEIKLGEEPALQGLGVPGEANDLPREWLAVNTGRGYINHEKWAFESTCHSRGVGERVPRRR